MVNEVHFVIIDVTFTLLHALYTKEYAHEVKEWSDRGTYASLWDFYKWVTGRIQHPISAQFPKRPELDIVQVHLKERKKTQHPCH